MQAPLPDGRAEGGKQRLRLVEGHTPTLGRQPVPNQSLLRDGEAAIWLMSWCRPGLRRSRASVAESGREGQPYGGSATVSEAIPDPLTKVCPQCAEEVKAAARICRFCGYQFAPLDTVPATPLPDAQPADAPVGSPDVPVKQRRAALTVELAGATHEWTEPVVVRQFEASRAGQIMIGDAAGVMRDHGYEPGPPIYDGQGAMNVTYTRRPNWRPEVPTPASISLPANMVRGKERRPGNTDTATRVGEMIGQIIVVGVIVIFVVAFFATGGLKSPASGTGGATTGGTQQPGAAGDAWPSGFKEGVCLGALFELQDAGRHLGALADAAQNFDVARATDEAAAVNDRAQKAQAQLDALPAWAPAGALVADLRTAATSLRQGANLFQIAVKANDADGVKQAATYIASGTSAITSATSDVSSLRSQYGFSCQ